MSEPVNLTTRLTHVTDRQDAAQETRADILAALDAIVSNTSPGYLPQMLDTLTSIDTRLAGIGTAIGDIRTAALSIDGGVSNIDAATSSIDTNLAQLRSGFDNFLLPGVENIFNATLDVARQIIATACVCAEGTTLAPELSTTPVAINGELCQRVQFYLDRSTDAIDVVARQIQNGATFTTALASVLLGAGVIPGVDLASVPAGLALAAITLLGVGVSERLSRIADWLAAHQSDLINVLYSAGNAAAAQEAWYAYVDANPPDALDPSLGLTIKLIAWSGTLGRIYDAETYPWEVSGYSDDVCSTVFLGYPDVFTRTFGVTTSGDMSHYYAAAWPSRPYWTLSDGGYGAGQLAIGAENIYVRVELIETGAGFQGLYTKFGDGTGEDYTGTITVGYDHTYYVGSGQKAYLAAYAGPATVRITVTEA